ncbi:Coatomer subunit beta' [Tetrabaena socialis]|uniref:Coatomer subunit beta n=1 Tax=Tetrabaena socialis TaxID=47790 RepID=A0A2J8A4D1_9CHLO|nr:Coatomer subunit beta' [Tetrabaena socialis]|eukprot:PNH07381.1 Coatomer subunit beta' [Tetrabaena socialis]
MKQLVQRTDRVKGVDVHPMEPWVLANLYNGNVFIWSYLDQAGRAALQRCSAGSVPGLLGQWGGHTRLGTEL